METFGSDTANKYNYIDVSGTIGRKNQSYHCPHRWRTRMPAACSHSLLRSCNVLRILASAPGSSDMSSLVGSPGKYVGSCAD